MIIGNLNALRVRLDDFVISDETSGHVNAVIEDLISAAIAQHTYQAAIKGMGDGSALGSDEREYARRTPRVFAQTWLRYLRDIAGELTFLADQPSTADGARKAAAAFEARFPGIAVRTGALRVTSYSDNLAYFAAGSSVYPVEIDDNAVRHLEAIAQTLIDALPKERSFQSTE